MKHTHLFATFFLVSQVGFQLANFMWNDEEGDNKIHLAN
jgi:hypothetical protein